MNIPSNTDAEKRLISTVLNTDEGIHNIKQVQPHHFYNEDLGTIYEACQKLAHKGVDPNIVSVEDYLSKQGKDLATVIVDCINHIVSLHALEVVESQIVDTYQKRRMLEVSQEIAQDIENGVETSEIIEKMGNELTSITDNLEVDKSKIADLIGDYKEWLKENYERIEASDGGIIGLSTGIEGVDELTDGIQDGHLWVIGAMTSGGKSAMMLNMVNAALNAGRKASVYSLEMSKNGIINRVLSIRNEWDASQIKRLGVDTAALTKSIEELGQQGLKIYDSNLSEIDQIMMSIVRDVRRNETDVIFIDYIQLVTHRQSREDRQKLEYVSKQLRMLAGRINKPIVVLSQKSNEYVDNPNKETAGFMGSGAIAQSATIAFTLKPDVPVVQRKELHKQGLPIPVKIDFDKSQEGAVSYTLASFIGKTGVFKTVDKDEFETIKAQGDINFDFDAD